MKFNNKINSFFNPTTNPGGGARFAESTKPTAPFRGPSLSSMLSNTAQRPQPVSPPMAQGGAQPAMPSAGFPSAAPAAVAAPMAAPAAAPMASEVPPIPSQWMKPDGTFFTPDEIAGNVATTLQQGSGQGDIGTLARNNFAGDAKTTEQMSTELRLLNNAQGDIASGAEDPFGIASDSGIAYTPAELQAIESSYAGIYDPAITSAMSKLERRQGQEEAASAAKIATEKAEAEFQNDLTILGKKHGYDLDKMKADQGFQMKLASYKSSLAASADAAKAGSGMTPYSDERSFRTVQTIDELMGQVTNKTVGFGSLLAGIPTTDATTFRSQLNTLKAAIAFGELTAMREASKTGGALGNVSNIELGLLESALAGLDTAQGVQDFKGQLSKAKESINRWRSAQGGSTLGTSEAPTGSIPVGETVQFEGSTYRSDGTQWVLVEKN